MDPIRLALSSDFRDEQSEAQRGEMTYSDHTIASRKGRIPCLMNPFIYVLIRVFTSQSQGWARGTEQ